MFKLIKIILIKKHAVLNDHTLKKKRHTNFWIQNIKSDIIE